VVPRRRKLVLLLQAGGRLPRAVAPEQAPAPLPATRFLLDMVPPVPARHAEPLRDDPPFVPQRPAAHGRSGTARILEMFERQEHRRLERRAPASMEALSTPPRAAASR
jgi:hypothetical protein